MQRKDCPARSNQNPMSGDNTFEYTYSAKENQEVLSIRNKYLPREESKLEELKRLDSLVQASGVTEGIFGCLIFGLGMCLAMGVIGNLKWLGILLGLVGIVAMVFAYPIYRRIFTRTKAQNTPRILQLAAELSGQL